MTEANKEKKIVLIVKSDMPIISICDHSLKYSIVHCKYVSVVVAIMTLTPRTMSSMAPMMLVTVPVMRQSVVMVRSLGGVEAVVLVLEIVISVLSHLDIIAESKTYYLF